MDKRNRTKLTAVVVASILTCLTAVFFNNVLDEDAVYTSLFYIPVIMAGLWFYRSAIPLSAGFALLINVLDFIRLGEISVEQIMRGLILILGGVILYYLEHSLHRRNEELRHSHRRLALETERLRVTLLSIGDGVISTDNEGRVTLLNDVAKNLTGWPGQTAIGKPFTEVFPIVNEQTRETCPDPVQKVLSLGKVVGLANHTVLIAKDGTERPIADSAAPIRSEDGTLDGVVLVFRDVTSEKIRQNEIEFMSFHDELTGVGNRRYLEEQLKQIDRQEYLPLSVIMGDVNGLKLTNDAFGHNMGDKLLKRAAEALKAACRSNEIICRYGGDEFVILLPQTDEAEAERIAQRLKEALDKIEIEPVRFSMSLGWATKTDMGESIMDTVKIAEDFMYKRKLYESPSTRGNIISSLMNAMKGNTDYEILHSDRIGRMCETIADAFGMGKEDLEKFKTACQFHDIGKITIDQAILNKAEPLTPEEWKAIKRHPETGYRILSSVPEFAEIAEYVLAHHERWDGKGYPKKLKGEAIPYMARLIMVAGSYDAMVSERPYRRPMSQDEAVAEIKRNAGIQFDPRIARIFVEKVLGKTW